MDLKVLNAILFLIICNYLQRGKTVGLTGEFLGGPDCFVTQNLKELRHAPTQTHKELVAMYICM